MDQAIPEIPYDPKIPTTRNALIIMVCNESANIVRTLSSISPLIKAVFMLDTGSTDDTIELARTFCQQNFLDFHVRVDPWIKITEHFLKRNKLLNFYYELSHDGQDFDWVFTADAVDEFRGLEYIRRALSANVGKYDCVQLTYCIVRKNDDQPLSTNTIVENGADASVVQNNISENFVMTKIFNSRVKFVYEWRVHEQAHRLNADGTHGGESIIIFPLQYTCVYQNRFHDDKKSAQRYADDYEALLLDHADSPHSSRPLLYMAQTAGNLGEYERAFYFYLCYLNRINQVQILHFCNHPTMRRWMEVASRNFTAGNWPFDLTETQKELDVMTLGSPQEYVELVNGLDFNKTMAFVGYSGRFVEIRIVCMRIVELLPVLAAKIGMGQDLMRQLKYLFVTEAIHHDQFLAECWCHYASYLHQVGQVREAYAVMKMVLELPEPVTTRYYRGQYYSMVRWSMMASLAMLLGKIDEAETYLNYLDSKKLSTAVDRYNRALLPELRERMLHPNSAQEPISIRCYL